MKWTPYEVNSSGNPIYLDYDNREYFSYNGYGHNHTLLPNTEGGCAIGIGNVDKQDADVTATWCIMPYNIYTEKKTDENTNGIPVITSIKRDASATMNIGSKNNKFNCLYVNAIHMGGHTYTSLNSGGGKIASYKATASQVNYNDDPKVETSVNTAGDTLTFKFSIPKGKDGTNGKDGKNGTRGPQGATGPRGPAGSVDYTSVHKIYHSDTSYYAEVTSNGNSRYFGPYATEGLNLGDTSCKWKNIWGKNGNITGSDEELKTQMSKINDIPNIESIYMKLNPIKYKYKNFDPEEDHDRFHFGFGARETEKIFNDYNLDTSDYGLICKDILLKPNKAGNIVEYALRYGEFIALNTHMTQKAHHRIDSLESENQSLKNEILMLQGQLSLIIQRLQKMEEKLC